MINISQFISQYVTERPDSMFVPDIEANKEFLTKEDRVLFIDDFLAYGSTGKGAIDLCRQAGATIEGMGFIIEKAFQNGRQILEQAGVTRIESLAIIDSLENGQIEFR